MIFSMYKDGFSIGRIAKRLNQMGVLSPMEYKHSAGVKFDTVFKTGDTAKWTYKAVQRILTNEVYIGVLAQGKRCLLYTSGRCTFRADRSDCQENGDECPAHGQSSRYLLFHSF